MRLASAGKAEVGRLEWVREAKRRVVQEDSGAGESEKCSGRWRVPQFGVALGLLGLLECFLGYGCCQLQLIIGRFLHTFY